MIEELILSAVDFLTVVLILAVVIYYNGQSKGPDA